MNDRDDALQIIKSGKTLLYPTDTVWGIGCDARDEAAVNRIIEIKQRPVNKSFIILLDSVDRLEKYIAEVPGIAYDLIDFSEEPITLVFDNGKNVSRQVLSETGSIAIRIVKQGFCHELIKRFRGPLLSTSANISGEPGALDFAGISRQIKESVDFIVPEKEARFMSDKPSTIMKLSADGTFTFIRR